MLGCWVEGLDSCLAERAEWEVKLPFLGFRVQGSEFKDSGTGAGGEGLRVVKLRNGGCGSGFRDWG